MALGILSLAGIASSVAVLAWNISTDGFSTDMMFFALVSVLLSGVALLVLLVRKPRVSVTYKEPDVAELAGYGQPHMTKFQECQDLISSSEGTNLYYQHAYRDTELSYWVHIPKWIMEMKDTEHEVKRCLDIGSAYGTLAVYARSIFGCDVYATDMASTYMSQKMAQENGIKFFEHNIETDEFPWMQDTKFDIIIFTEVLEHLNLYPVPTLRKIRSQLSENGRIFLSTPDSASWGITTKYYSSLAEMPTSKKDGQEMVDDHIWQYSRDELLYVLGESGLLIEKLEYSPGVAGRHFNLCLRMDPSFVPEQHTSWENRVHDTENARHTQDIKANPA